jgi:pimeloyl-CoA synthetase
LLNNKIEKINLAEEKESNLKIATKSYSRRSTGQKSIVKVLTSATFIRIVLEF